MLSKILSNQIYMINSSASIKKSVFKEAYKVFSLDRLSKVSFNCIH